MEDAPTGVLSGRYPGQEFGPIDSIPSLADFRQNLRYLPALPLPPLTNNSSGRSVIYLSYAMNTRAYKAPCRIKANFLNLDRSTWNMRIS